MGCDIHAFVEEKIGTSDKYYCYMQLFLERDYTLFALLADVRNYSQKPLIPISSPKGLPDNLSWVVNKAHGEWGEDAHSETYLDYEEIGKVYMRACLDDNVNKQTEKQLLILQHTMSRMNKPRLILWFDC